MIRHFLQVAGLLLRYGTGYDHFLNEPDVNRVCDAIKSNSLPPIEVGLRTMSPDDRSTTLAAAVERLPWTESYRLHQLHPDCSVAHTLLGLWAIKQAWELRTGGTASMVTADGWKGFAKYLGIAREALERAVELDPSDPEPLVGLMIVGIGGSDGYSEVESLFNRAVELCPNHFAAHSRMLMQSTAKWGGSDDKMRRFVGKVTAAAPLGSRLHSLACDLVLEEYFADEDDSIAYETFLKRPHFRTAITRAYTACLRAPSHTLGKSEIPIRSKFAWYLYATGSHDQARDELRKLGKRFHTEFFMKLPVREYGPAIVKNMRRELRV